MHPYQSLSAPVHPPIPPVPYRYHISTLLLADAQRQDNVALALLTLSVPPLIVGIYFQFPCPVVISPLCRRSLRTNIGGLPFIASLAHYFALPSKLNSVCFHLLYSSAVQLSYSRCHKYGEIAWY